MSRSIHVIIQKIFIARGDPNMTQKKEILFSMIKWFLIAFITLVFLPGVLMKFSLQFELNKFIYLQEYKELREQYKKVAILTNQYIEATNLKWGYTLLLKKTLIDKDGNPITTNLNKQTIGIILEGFSEYIDKTKKLTKQMTNLRIPLEDDYKNLAVFLKSDKKLISYKKEHLEKMAIIIESSNKLNQEKIVNIDFSELAYKMLLSYDPNSINEIIRIAPFDIIIKDAELDLRRAELIKKMEEARFKKVRDTLSKKIVKQLDENLFSYFWKVFGL